MNMKEITVTMLLNLAWRKLWALLLAAVVVGAGAYTYCRYLVTPVYTSSASILVTNGALIRDLSQEESEGKVSGSDVSSSISLMDTVVDILRTPDAFVKMVEETKSSYSPLTLQGMATVARRNGNTMFVDVSFRNTEAKETIRLANVFADFSCRYIADCIPGSSARVISTATQAGKVSPRTRSTVLMAALIGAALAFGIALIIELSDNTVKSTDDLVAEFDVPTLGSVPNFEAVQSGRYGKYGKYSKYGRYSRYGYYGKYGRYGKYGQEKGNSNG